MAVIGHNSQSLTSAAEANVETGVYLLCREMLVTAIHDTRLERGHLRVLACFASLINARTAKVWPSRDVIASMTGTSVRHVSNTISELRKMGYLISEREPVEQAGGRRMNVYTFGNIDHEQIRNEITKFCLAVQKQRDETSPHTVNKTSPPTVNFTAHGEQHVTAYGELYVTAHGELPSVGHTKKPEKSQVKSTTNGDLNDVNALAHADKINNNNIYNNKLTTVGELGEGGVGGEDRKSEKPKSDKKPKRVYAKRLADDWVLPKSWGVWALDHFTISREQIISEAEHFKDYWLSRGDHQARKIDWQKTWQNWIRNSRNKYRKRKIESSVAPDLLNVDPQAEQDRRLQREAEENFRKRQEQDRQRVSFRVPSKPSGDLPF